MVVPLSTYTYIPKSLGRRYAKLATTAINRWLKEIEHGSVLHAPSWTRAATLFLIFFDYLVARDITAIGGGEAGTSNQVKSQQIAGIVRLRLQALEQGQWLQIIDNALRDTNLA